MVVLRAWTDRNGEIAAERSESKYVIGREGWKTMIVRKLMFICGKGGEMYCGVAA